MRDIPSDFSNIQSATLIYHRNWNKLLQNLCIKIRCWEH
jgi:hypothetical protein